MTKFIHKIQDLSKKAAEIKQAVQSAPVHAAKLREAVVMSAGELQQIRLDVQSNLSGLQANNEERLLKAMREINDSTYTLEEAGYELTGMDLDFALNQRLAVHLQKFEDVHHSKLRALLSKETSETVKSILSGIIKAEETAANVELTHLKYEGLMIHVGSVPLLRMCWGDGDANVVEQTVAKVPPLIKPTVESQPAPVSFFEPRPIPASPKTTSTPSDLPPTSSASAPTARPDLISGSAKEVETGNSPWSREALDRFKKMPDLSKYRRSGS